MYSSWMKSISKLSVFGIDWLVGWLVGWLVYLFDCISTVFGSFNVELSHFDKVQAIQILVYTQLNIKTVLFQTIQFCIRTQFSSIWPLDRTLSGVTIPGQSEPGSDGNKGVLRIPQSSSHTGALPSVCLVSYLGHSLGEFYLSAEK